MTPKFLVIDLFCGAGGVTEGFEQTEGGVKVIACVNHEELAIASHHANHPDAVHFLEDFRKVDLVFLKQIVDNNRRKYPEAKVIVWASLPCPHFSKARGGTPKDDEIRTLAYSLYMQYDFDKKKHYKGDSYIQVIDPDYVLIENVTEFKSWGPLDEKGKPLSRKNGVDFWRWRNGICELGYRTDWRELNSADFGALTSRNRLFGCFAKGALPIVWPEPTHAKNPNTGLLYDTPLKKWEPVKKAIDFSDDGISIFDRKKPLCKNTLSAIYEGLLKALKEGESDFMFKYYGTGDNFNSINVPAGTLTVKDRFAKLKIEFILRDYKRRSIHSLSEPIGALPTVPKAYLLSYIFNPSYGGHTVSTSKPCPVIVASQDKAPLYLIMVEMKKHHIKDIKMRMLKVPELLQIQGFPPNYILKGPQSEQKKFIGNSVVPGVIKAWANTMIEHFTPLQKSA